MARGKNAKVGDTRTAPNGYHYTKTEDGWRLTHHILAEKSLGRKIKKNERVYFKDGDRTNLSKDNVLVKRVRTKKDRLAEIDNKIAILKQEREELLADMKD